MLIVGNHYLLAQLIMVIQRKPGGNPEVKNSEYEQ